MKVGVDATGWLNRRGGGRFVRNVVRHLVELDAGSTYVLYIGADSADSARLPAGVDVRRIPLGPVWARGGAAASNRSVRDLAHLARGIRKDRLDAFVFPSVVTYFPVWRLPNVVGIHDAIVAEFPELTVPGRRARMLWTLKHRIAIRRATRLFTLSDAAREALVEHANLRRDEIAIVRPAAEQVFHPVPEAKVEPARRRAGLERREPYLLFASGISPHKNLPTLLRAYANLRATTPAAPRLVIAGALESETYASSATQVRELVAALRLREHVLLPGFVADDELAGLYSGSSAVVLPSLAEGFGLPAVEAAACRAALVVSEIPAHRELLGDAGLYFPPLDVGALADQLRRLLGDTALRDTVAARAHARVAGLTWAAGAERLRSLVVEAVGASRDA